MKASGIVCTFSETGAQLVPQFCYLCKTCNNDSKKIGYCTACAFVCHSGHELQIKRSKGFYCDCGANNQCKMMPQIQRDVHKQSGLKFTLKEGKTAEELENILRKHKVMFYHVDKYRYYYIPYKGDLALLATLRSDVAGPLAKDFEVEPEGQLYIWYEIDKKYIKSIY